MLNQQKRYNQTLHSLQTNDDIATTKHCKIPHKKASLLERMYDFIWKTNIHVRTIENEKAEKRNGREKQCRGKGNRSIG